MPSSKGSSQPRNRTHVSYVFCIVSWVLCHCCHQGSPFALHQEAKVTLISPSNLGLTEVWCWESLEKAAEKVLCEAGSQSLEVPGDWPQISKWSLCIFLLQRLKPHPRLSGHRESAGICPLVFYCANQHDTGCSITNVITNHLRT